eukprot:TRINITY_DN3114_c0_g1_i3.p2 TRINITY_DN3114_c0_g1~~TRINITY_DN3114_c0_g1_i3.p2  ORF type:complete len:104 (-),score=7.89 TRINITY_DN3114_c0_g1_i3:1096-1407(-)
MMACVQKNVCIRMNDMEWSNCSSLSLGEKFLSMNLKFKIRALLWHAFESYYDHGGVHLGQKPFGWLKSCMAQQPVLNFSGRYLKEEQLIQKSGSAVARAFGER